MKSIHVEARTLPEAWETAVRRCWDEGARFRTQYDKPGDPPSRDVACLIHVKEPFAEPRIHKAFPGGLEDLEVYRAEVLYGVHDHWAGKVDGQLVFDFETQQSKRWNYTYHQRVSAYKVPGLPEPINQVAVVVEMLKDTPYTRRAQAVTWQAWYDPEVEDPPCLQRLWFRVEAGHGKIKRKLNMVAHMRSNDAYKAAFMNMYAFTELQKEVAKELGVEVGEYCHVADSFHIYGSYFAEFEGFLGMVARRPDRFFTTEFARPMFEDGARRLLAEEGLPEEKHRIMERRLAELAGA
jgi:thymidylate synthase